MALSSADLGGGTDVPCIRFRSGNVIAFQMARLSALRVSTRNQARGLRRRSM
jgi:hypothetical protein